MTTGKERRLRRLLSDDGRSLLIAVDHAVTTGFAGGLLDVGRTMRDAVAGGADGVVAHRGSAERQMPAQRGTGLIVHLSGNTGLSAESDLKVRVCDPETALALGADAVSAHVTLGCGHAEDREALRDLGAIAGTCQRLGLPLLAMTYVRSASTPSHREVLHAARVAAELGADLVKTTSSDLDTAAELAARIPVPVVLAGGSPADEWEAFLDFSAEALRAGVAGLCVGRRVFGRPDPAAAVAQLSALVHGRAGAYQPSLSAAGAAR